MFPWAALQWPGLLLVHCRFMQLRLNRNDTEVFDVSCVAQEAVIQCLSIVSCPIFQSLKAHLSLFISSVMQATDARSGFLGFSSSDQPIQPIHLSWENRYQQSGRACKRAIQGSLSHYLIPWHPCLADWFFLWHRITA